MKKNDFVFNAALNTATISAEFAKKASNPNSAEYRYLCKKRLENPTLNIVVRTHTSGTRYTYKDMEARLRGIDKNGKLIEAFNLVKEIAKDEKSPYTYVYNWFKAQMDAAKEEKKNEKKASAGMSKEDMMKKLAELTAGISYNASADTEDDMEMEEEFKEETV